jgi:pimeloyl-ACP methyl ester carboxylesterase
MTSSGVLRERFAYVRLGEGGPPIVVLPGLSLHNATPGVLQAKGYAATFRPLAKDHTLYFVQRPRGLPAGTTTRDIAADYADLIAGEIGPADVIGMSTGGLIAQYLALDRPDVARSLSLVVAGVRLAPEGRAICHRWQGMAAQRRWRRLYGDIAAVAVDGRAAQWIARTLMPAFGSRPSPEQAADFAVTVEAVLGHHADLSGLAVPALVIGGAKDPFFSASILRETAADASIYPGAGHGLPKRHGKRVLDEIAAFLRRRVSA